MISIEQYVAKNGLTFINRFLKPWIAIPSISSDASHHNDMIRAADYLAAELQQSGFTVRKCAVKNGNDAVYAEKIVDPNLPTVLIYGHYDVQPVTQQADQWLTDPFELTIKGERMFARGIADDKGQIAAHLLAMRYFAKQGQFPCNIKFIIEGDEENNDSFSEFVLKNPQLLSCDLVMISDTDSVREGYPALTTSLRGIVGATLKVETPVKLVQIVSSTHNPKTNRILIPGFYDHLADYGITRKMSDEFVPNPRMGRFLKPEDGFSVFEHLCSRPTNDPLHLGYINTDPKMRTERAYKIVVHGPNGSVHSGSHGGPVQNPALHLSHFLTGLVELNIPLEIDYLSYSTFNRTTAILPTAEAQLNTTYGVDLGDAIKRLCEVNDLKPEMVTIELLKERRDYLDDPKINERLMKNVGSCTTPRARLSFRIVADQNPQQLSEGLKVFLSAQGAETEIDKASPAYLADFADPYVQAAVTGLEKGFDIDGAVDLKYDGASIPTAAALTTATGVPIAFMGFAGADTSIHGPNETNGLPYLLNGAKSSAEALKRIGKLPRRAA